VASSSLILLILLILIRLLLLLLLLLALVAVYVRGSRASFTSSARHACGRHAAAGARWVV